MTMDSQKHRQGAKKNRKQINIFGRFSEFLRSGRIGQLPQKVFYIVERRRINFWKKKLHDMGEMCLIRPGVKLFFPEKIRIGNNVSIQDDCYLSGYGSITIGNDVSIGTGVRVVSSEHDYSKGIIRNNQLVEKPVKIGSNVWIGMNVSILGGSVINDNTVIGAGSVVKGEVGPGVYVGAPARFIKNLDGSGSIR